MFKKALLPLEISYPGRKEGDLADGESRTGKDPSDGRILTKVASILNEFRLRLENSEKSGLNCH